jgi:outer membrane lipoprotein SlyB
MEIMAARCGRRKVAVHGISDQVLTMRNSRLLMSVLVGAMLAACASREPLMSTDGGTLVRDGQVVDVRDVTVSGNHTSGIGSFVGTVLGAVAGSAVGGGNGRSLATAGGAVAGNVAGGKMEAAAGTRTRTALTVRFENGDTRIYDLDPDPTLRVGQQVQIVTHQGRTTVTRRQ